jgi:hypothetical protein
MASSDSTGALRSWAPITGRWSIKPELLRYLGPQQDPRYPFGICVTNADLSDGSVSTRVRLSENTEGRILLGYRSPTERYLMAGLGGWGFAYTIGEFEPAFGWRGLAVAGSSANLSPERPYEVKAAVTGQRISLSVDDVRVLDHVLEKPLTGGQLGLFTWGEQPVEFTSFAVERRPGTVFVVMQFSEPYKQLYEEVIKPVTCAFGFRAYHVGEVFGPGMILHDIAQGIVDAKVIIAEITPVKQNVFYELGYAHALVSPQFFLPSGANSCRSISVGTASCSTRIRSVAKNKWRTA